MINEKDIKNLHKRIDAIRTKKPDAVEKVFNNGIEMTREEIIAWLLEVINKK